MTHRRLPDLRARLFSGQHACPRAQLVSRVMLWPLPNLRLSNRKRLHLLQVLGSQGNQPCPTSSKACESLPLSPAIARTFGLASTPGASLSIISRPTYSLAQCHVGNAGLGRGITPHALLVDVTAAFADVSSATQRVCCALPFAVIREPCEPATRSNEEVGNVHCFPA